MYLIEAMNGPLDGRRWPFTGTITIGRNAPDVDAVLAADRAVSRRHARIAEQAGTLWLTDLASSNGTFVGAAQISASVPICVGQPFLIGRTLLRVLPDSASRSD